MAPDPSAGFVRTTHLLRAGAHRLTLGERTLVLGILNCTPDSFSDGGRHLEPDAAIRHLHRLAEEGADAVDVGGESTRPGSESVSAEEEWRRIEPVVREAGRPGFVLPLSIDTTKAEVAARALDLGASILNDVSGLRSDHRLAELAARSGAALVLMHMQGTPRTMQVEPSYQDVGVEVGAFLRSAAEKATQLGVSEDQIVIDPGLGFGKTPAHNLELLRRLPELAGLGYPILVGASRKSFLGKVLDLPVEDRLEASLAAHVAAVLGGAHLVRTHDVRATVRAVRVADAILRSAL